MKTKRLHSRLFSGLLRAAGGLWDRLTGRIRVASGGKRTRARYARMRRGRICAVAREICRRAAETADA